MVFSTYLPKSGYFVLTLGGGTVGRKNKNVDGLLMAEGEGGSKITKMLTFG